MAVFLAPIPIISSDLVTDYQWLCPSWPTLHISIYATFSLHFKLYYCTLIVKVHKYTKVIVFFFCCQSIDKVYRQFSRSYKCSTNFFYHLKDRLNVVYQRLSVINFFSMFLSSIYCCFHIKFPFIPFYTTHDIIFVIFPVSVGLETYKLTLFY